MISVTFALIAFTQKSLADGDTDIVRYYAKYSSLANSDFSVGQLIMLGDDLLTFTFSIVNIILVRTFGNVQCISIFWTFLTYYLTFLSIFKMTDIICKDSNKNWNFFLIILFVAFGAILFTQVTDTIKAAASFSMFFYTLTLVMENRPPLIILVCLILGIGIHAQILMLTPILFYKHIPTKPLLYAVPFVIIFCSKVNILEMISHILPSGQYGELLSERAVMYAEDNGGSSTKRYICIGIMIYLIAVYLYRSHFFTEKNRIGTIVLLYIILMFLNFNNSSGFIRFANFSSFILSIEFLVMMEFKKNGWIKYIFMILIMLLNLQLTLGRTFTGVYISSYFDNSASKLLFSNVVNYLSFKTY